MRVSTPRRKKPALSSPGSFVILQENRFDLAQKNRIRDALDSLLAADTQPDFVPTRADYPVAARTLAYVIGNPNAVSVLVTETPYENVLLWRCASVTGAWLRSNRMPPPDLADRLRAENTEAARVALAMSGNPVAEWPQLGRAERAALLLRSAVDAMRRGFA